MLAATVRASWLELVAIGRSAGDAPLVAVRIAHHDGPTVWRVPLVGSQHGNEPAGRDRQLEPLQLHGRDQLET